MIEVLLLEPDGWRFRGLASVMRDSGEIDVLGELDYGRIISLTEKPENLSPQVIVIAHRLVLEYGVALIPMMRDVFEPCAVLVHGELESLEIAAQVFAAGARGYFALSNAPGMLPKAVGVVSRGKYWGSREAVAMMAEQLLDENVRHEQDEDVDSEEQTILSLLHEGLSNKEIGQRLGLAETTIKARFNRLYKKFGVASRLQLLTKAMRDGLLRK